MKLDKILFSLLLLLTPFNSFCQEASKVEMADVFRQDGKIYTVVFALVVILTAMIILLIRVDRRIFRLEQEMKNGK